MTRIYVITGLKHTAFSLYHEANLEKVDSALPKVLPKMLIGYLEKALLFNQIETHIYKDEHIECKEPFELLAPHQCRTTDLKKQELVGKINQCNHDLESVLNEEDSNTGVIHKVKVTNKDISEIVLSQKLDLVALYGQDDDHVSLWKLRIDSETNKTALRPHGIIDFACLNCRKEDFVKMQWDATGENLVVCFNHGGLYFFDSNSTSVEFDCLNLNIGELRNVLTVNPNFLKDQFTWSPFSNEIISLLYEDNYMPVNDSKIINPVQTQVLVSRSQKLKALVWQNTTNYAILTAEDQVFLYDIASDMGLQSFMADVLMSDRGSTLSKKTNCIKVWTITSKDYLYSFTDSSSVVDFIWNSTEEDNFFNFIVVIFSHTAKLFDIEYGEVKCTIDLEMKVPIISSILYNRDTYIMITQEDGTISIYSLFTNNMKRLHYVMSTGEVNKLIKWGNSNSVGSSKNDLFIVRLKKILP